MYKQLTSEQRYTISVLLQNRTKQKEIAKVINVSPSTVSREIRRNSGVRGRYNWETAQANAVQTKRRKPGNIHLLSPFKEHVKSITTDNGTEFACHEMIGKSLGVTICFADPYASWQKEAIENANGLIRQYVPKTETFEHVSHQQITKYSKKINIRPRKKLEFKTPHECFYEQIK